MKISVKGHYDLIRYAKWGLIHMALIIFFADLIAAFWPAFSVVWTHVAHWAVAMAAFTATVAEYINLKIEEAQHRAGHSAEESEKAHDHHHQGTASPERGRQDGPPEGRELPE